MEPCASAFIRRRHCLRPAQGAGRRCVGQAVSGLGPRRGSADVAGCPGVCTWTTNGWVIPWCGTGGSSHSGFCWAGIAGPLKRSIARTPSTFCTATMSIRRDTSLRCGGRARRAGGRDESLAGYRSGQSFVAEATRAAASRPGSHAGQCGGSHQQVGPLPLPRAGRRSWEDRQDSPRCGLPTVRRGGCAALIGSMASSGRGDTSCSSVIWFTAPGPVYCSTPIAHWLIVVGCIWSSRGTGKGTPHWGRKSFAIN